MPIVHAAPFSQHGPAASYTEDLTLSAGPLYMLQVYDRVLSSGKVETLLLLTLMLAVALLVWASLETLRTAITVRIGAWLNQALGPYFLESGVRARLAGENPGGQAFRDLSQVQSFVATAGMNAFFDLPWTPIFIAVIWMLHPWLGMLGLVAAITLLALSAANEFATRHPLKAANEGQLSANRLAETTIRNADAVSAMGMGRALLLRWARLSSDTQRDLLSASQRGAIISGAAKFFRMLFQSGTLGLGAYVVIRGEATPGIMIASSILLGRALAPVDVAMSAWKSLSYDFFRFPCEKGAAVRHTKSAGQRRGTDRQELGRLGTELK